jgi:hypothetical protein
MGCHIIAQEQTVTLCRNFFQFKRDPESYLTGRSVSYARSPESQTPGIILTIIRSS